MRKDPNAPHRILVRCGKCAGLSAIETPPLPILMEVMTKAMLAARCPACGSKKLLMGQERSWAEDQAQMGVPLDASMEERARDWLYTGEPGTSAETIFAVMTGETPKDHGVPDDAGALRRCLLLLRRIPEWRDRLPEMAPVSAGWAKLVPEWPRLAASFEAETGEAYARSPAPRTSNLLRELAG